MNQLENPTMTITMIKPISKKGHLRRTPAPDSAMAKCRYFARVKTNVLRKTHSWHGRGRRNVNATITSTGTILSYQLFHA